MEQRLERQNGRALRRPRSGPTPCEAAQSVANFRRLRRWGWSPCAAR